MADYLRSVAASERDAIFSLQTLVPFNTPEEIVVPQWRSDGPSGFKSRTWNLKDPTKASNTKVVGVITRKLIPKEKADLDSLLKNQEQ